MNIDTVSLQCFIALAETLNFTKAADRVGRTQSALSQQIAKLEHYFGKPLVLRGKQTQLSSEGEVFLSYARKIYALQRELIDRLQEPELEGELHFGLPEDFAATILADVLVEFSQLHPRVILNLECDLSKNLIQGFEQKRLDLILIKDYGHQLNHHARHIWQEKVEWVGHRARLPELNSEGIVPLVLSPSPCVYRENVIQVLNEAHLNWTMTYSSPSHAGKMAAVRAGLGITAIQKKLIPSDLNILNYDFLPPLNDIQILLMKANYAAKPVDTLEFFILKKLQFLN